LGLACSAALATVRGESKTAGRLYGAATAQLESLQLRVSSLGPLIRQEFEHYQALARAQAGEAAFEAALQEGRGMTLEQAIELAMKESETSEAWDQS
jgi:hypothetical protein